MKHTLSVLVENKAGVLARVSSLLARRGFNIHSLAVGPTADESISRMTIVVNAPELEQVKKQLHKLVNVVKITELDPETAVEREVALIRVSTDGQKRGDVLEVATLFDAVAVDVGVSTIMFLVAGAPDKVNDFVELVRPYGIADLAKSGRVALARDQKSRKLRTT
ncbi:MAG: acetolactate synthase small subunit [Acidimicrobiia bacterium]|jgi:acetolactate synthase-1/3 small subunit|nr:acetolactate synthase small subunit [Acidimicrobiia bacterium]